MSHLSLKYEYFHKFHSLSLFRIPDYEFNARKHPKPHTIWKQFTAKAFFNSKKYPNLVGIFFSPSFVSNIWRSYNVCNRNNGRQMNSTDKQVQMWTSQRTRTEPEWRRELVQVFCRPIFCLISMWTDTSLVSGLRRRPRTENFELKGSKASFALNLPVIKLTFQSSLSDLLTTFPFRTWCHFALFRSPTCQSQHFPSFHVCRGNQAAIFDCQSNNL